METINALAVIHDILGECFIHIDKAEADHARDKFTFRSVAIHLWNYKERDMIPILFLKPPTPQWRVSVRLRRDYQAPLTVDYWLNHI
jgi:hypothetical protein